MVTGILGADIVATSTVQPKWLLKRLRHTSYVALLSLHLFGLDIYIVRIDKTSPLERHPTVHSGACHAFCSFMAPTAPP